MTVFWTFSGFTGIWLYTLIKSIVEKIHLLYNICVKSSMWDAGYLSSRACIQLLVVPVWSPCVFSFWHYVKWWCPWVLRIIPFFMSWLNSVLAAWYLSGASFLGRHASGWPVVVLIKCRICCACAFFLLILLFLGTVPEFNDTASARWQFSRTASCIQRLNLVSLVQFSINFFLLVSGSKW